MYLVPEVELNNFLIQDFLSSRNILHAELRAESLSPLINCSDPAHIIPNQTLRPESRHQKMRKKPLLTITHLRSSNLHWQRTQRRILISKTGQRFAF